MRDSHPASPLDPTSGLALSRTTIGVSPIFTQVQPDCAELNQRLRRLVLERMVTSAGLKKSNCGGWQSERNLQLWEDPAIHELLERMRAMVREVVARTVPDPGEELLDGWDIEAWANVNQLDDTVAAHVHSGGLNMWAAIYYVDRGQSPDAVSSGFTRFMNIGGTPRPIPVRGRAASAPGGRVPDASAGRVPGGGASDPGGASGPGGGGEPADKCVEPDWAVDHDLQIEPTPGKMVVFPATLPHYVTPYLGTEKRITIAFNLRHTGFMVTDFENRHSRRRTLWRDYRGPMLIMFELKRSLRSALARLIPVDKWPPALRRKLLGGAD